MVEANESLVKDYAALKAELGTVPDLEDQKVECKLA